MAGASREAQASREDRARLEQTHPLAGPSSVRRFSGQFAANRINFRPGLLTTTGNRGDVGNKYVKLWKVPDTDYRNKIHISRDCPGLDAMQRVRAKPIIVDAVIVKHLTFCDHCERRLATKAIWMEDGDPQCFEIEDTHSGEMCVVIGAMVGHRLQ